MTAEITQIIAFDNIDESYSAARAWEPTTQNHDPAHLAFARECYAAGYAAAMAAYDASRMEARLERARAAYDANLETLHAEHRLRMLAEIERDAVIGMLIDTSAARTGRGDPLFDVLLPDGYSPLGFAWTQDFATKQDAVDAVRKAAGLAPEERDR